MQSIGDALRMSCGGGSSKTTNASSSSDAAATTTTLVISASDAKSINLPAAPPVKNGHTSWVSPIVVLFYLFLFPLPTISSPSVIPRSPTISVNRSVASCFPRSFMTDEAVSRQEPTEQSQQHPEIGAGRAREQPDGDEQMQVQQRRRQEAHQGRRRCCRRGRDWSGPSHAFPLSPPSDDGLQAVAFFAGPDRLVGHIGQDDKHLQQQQRHVVYFVVQLIKVCFAIFGERWLPPHVARADG